MHGTVEAPARDLHAEIGRPPAATRMKGPRMRLLHQRFILVLPVVVSLVCWSLPPPPAPAWVETFDEGAAPPGIPKGWSLFSSAGQITVTDEQAHSGKHSLKLVDPSKKDAAGLRSPRLAVSPGDVCWVACWYYGDRGNHASLYMEFWTADGKRPKPHAKSTLCRGTGKWVEVILRFVPPPGTVAITAHANSFSGNVTTGYFDDIEVGIGAKPVFDRRPQPPAPVNHPCGLYKPEDIARAQRNLEKHEWAQKTLASLKSASRFWMNCPDEKLPYWIPDLTPFRVVDCPKCGAGWRFAWTHLSSDAIRCRSCGLVWPNADYPEKDSGVFLDPLGQEQQIPYHKGTPSKVYGSAKSPVFRLSGRLRYCRIGKLGQLGNLGKVYALTGDVAYAKKVRSVLLRFAQVYPHYLPHDWRRIYQNYGNLQSGKLSGWKLHDAGTFIQLAHAYDLTYNSGVYSPEDKVAIEEGCFREFARLMTATSPKGCCINDGPTAMAAGALAGLMLADHASITWAIERPDGLLGFLEKYFYRDGHWYESSPSYEGMTLSRLYVTPEALRGYSDPPSYMAPDRYDDLNLFEHPLMKRILVAGVSETMPDGRLPPMNDSTLGARYPRARTEQQFFWYPTDENLRLMAWGFGGKAAASGGQYALFRRDPDLDLARVEPAVPSRRSIVRPGAGWGVLRTGATSRDAALVLDYGRHGSGHGHPDRLNIIYYDFGREMVTDLGYLGAGHPHHPWIRSTAAHNVVIIDGQPQARSAGELEGFVDLGHVKAIVASATPYGDTTSIYRRWCLLVDHGLGRRYLFDAFQVEGGGKHLFTFHGDGSQFTPPQGTAQEVDASELGNPKTGFQWLRAVRRVETDTVVQCEWRSDASPHLKTRLTALPDGKTTVYHATASGLRNRSTPFAQVDMTKVFLERSGPSNTFVSIVDAYPIEPAVTSIRELAVEGEVRTWCKAVEVRQGQRVDVIVVNGDGAAASTVRIQGDAALEFRGHMAFVSTHRGRPVQAWMAEGQALRWQGFEILAESGWHGKIVEIDADSGTVIVGCSLPGGERTLAEYLLAPGQTDGAYRIARVSPHPQGSQVVLAGNPIINLKPGDSVRCVNAAAVESPAPGVWAIRGRAQSVTVPLAESNRPTAEPGPMQLMTCDESLTWHKVPGPPVPGTATALSIPKACLQRDQTQVRVVPIGSGNGDQAPPRVVAALVGQRRLTPDGALGVLRRGEAVKLIVDEPSGLLVDHLYACITSDRAGVQRVDVGIRQSGQRAGEWLLEVAPDTLRGEPAAYTLEMSLTDTWLHSRRVQLEFTIGGHILPIRKMRLVASSGKASKELSGLDTMFYRAETEGDYVAYEFDVPVAGRYRVRLRHTLYSSYGIFRVVVDDASPSQPVDGYAPDLQAGAGLVDVGEHVLSTGPHRLKLESCGQNANSAGRFLGACSLLLEPITEP